ncbi:hypothetical protein P7H17_00050 [Paenibacillus larvae]|nr:hypothetical protein [Paenibacillus larvae]MDT2284836.1 hypothetical protein [Paenibacillus larvae]
MALIVKIGADIRSFDKEMKKLTKDTETIGKSLRVLKVSTNCRFNGSGS